MFNNIFVQIIIYITLIALMHYLYIYFKNNLTTPKIKDLINKPLEDYKKIYKTLHNNENAPNVDIQQPNNDGMKNELKSFFKSLNTDNTTNTITTTNPPKSSNTLQSTNIPNKSNKPLLDSTISNYSGNESMAYSSF